jgi:hypothetical protein
MGQQVNFYLTSDDMTGLMREFAKCGDFVALDSRPLQSHPRSLPSIEYDERGEPGRYFYLTRPEFVASVKTYKVEHQDYWHIDDGYSPVIELIRCFSNERLIRRGRLYIIDHYYDEDGQKVMKPESFLHWAKCVFASAKKTLKYDATLGAYVGPDALARVQGPEKWVLESV